MSEATAPHSTGKSPNEADPADVVSKVRALLETHYVFPDIAAAVSGVLAEGLAAGRYPSGAPELADAVTADLQSVNGDLHLRLRYHDEPLPERTLQRGRRLGGVRGHGPVGGADRPRHRPGGAAPRAISGTWTCSRSSSRR